MTVELFTVTTILAVAAAGFSRYQISARPKPLVRGTGACSAASARVVVGQRSKTSERRSIECNARDPGGGSRSAARVDSHRHAHNQNSIRGAANGVRPRQRGALDARSRGPRVIGSNLRVRGDGEKA